MMTEHKILIPNKRNGGGAVDFALSECACV